MRLMLCVLLSALVFTALGDESSLRGEADVVFSSPGGKDLFLDWYRPDDKELYPGLVTIHGGGWTSGTKQGFTTIAKDLAAKGYVVANIEYRLATEARFPAAVIDCKAAVRWMRENAEMIGVDPEKIGAVGGSAGGHLAAMLATTGDHEDFIEGKAHAEISDALDAVVIMGAGVDQVARVKAAPNQRIKNCIVFFGGEFSDIPEVYAQGSPITHVSAKTAPVLMLDGGKDRPGERYGDFQKKLDEAGVKHELAVVPDAAHGQWGKSEFRGAFIEEMDKFFRSLNW